MYFYYDMNKRKLMQGLWMNYKPHWITVSSSIKWEQNLFQIDEH